LTNAPEQATVGKEVKKYELFKMCFSLHEPMSKTFLRLKYYFMGFL
jgi:hypothetical protein